MRLADGGAGLPDPGWARRLGGLRPPVYQSRVYKPQPLRSLEEIRADILALEQETEGLLEEIIGKDA